MALPHSHTRGQFAVRVITAAAWLLFVKVFLQILLQYQYYFPPDFQNGAFLIGREAQFTAIYRAAFYVHLLAGPIVLVGAAILVVTAGKPIRWHRAIGKLLWFTTVFALGPSGVVLACSSRGGWIAGGGFLCLSTLTMATVSMAALTARRRQMAAHQIWAMRSLALLASPMVLRLISGVMIVSGAESMGTYQMSAWISWVVPLAVVEWTQRPRLPRQAQVEH